MIATLLITSTLLAQATTPTPPAPPTPPARQIGVRSETDQTVTVTKGTRLDLNDCEGDLIVNTWNRDAVRVQAIHSRRTRVRVEQRGQVLAVGTEGSLGPDAADLQLTVPAWISMHVEGRDCQVDVDGVTGGVSAETVEGDIRLINVGGNVSAKSVEGDVRLENSRGRAEINTIEGDITIVKSQGEISAECVDGNVTITDSTLSALEVSTVDGDISYSGALQGSGRYLISTHDGNVDMALPDNTNATFGIRASRSDRVGSSLPLKSNQASTRGRRAVYTIGSGSAQVELEVFDGDVRIHRIGETRKD